MNERPERIMMREIMAYVDAEARRHGEAHEALPHGLFVMIEHRRRDVLAFERAGTWPTNLEVRMYAAYVPWLPQGARFEPRTLDGWNILEYVQPAATVSA